MKKALRTLASYLAAIVIVPLAIYRPRYNTQMTQANGNRDGFF